MMEYKTQSNRFKTKLYETIYKRSYAYEEQMKINKSFLQKVIREAVKEELDADPNLTSATEDDEGAAARRHLHHLANTAKELHDMLEPGDQLETWVQEKIALASVCLTVVKNYLEYDGEELEQKMDENPY